MVALVIIGLRVEGEKMVAKKSLIEAMNEAKAYSLKFKGIKTYVMDVKGKRSKWFTIPYIVREVILCGWHIHTVFENGVEVRRKEWDI